MSSKINRDYEVMEGEISSVKKNIDHNCLELKMKIHVFTQGYPGCRTPGGYEEQITYLKDVFDVRSNEELVGKKLIALCSSADVFCIFNPENSKFYSLQAKFFPEQYADSLNQIKKEENIEISKDLDDFNALMIGVIKAQRDKNSIKTLEHALEKEQLKKINGTSFDTSNIKMLREKVSNNHSNYNPK